MAIKRDQPCQSRAGADMASPAPHSIIQNFPAVQQSNCLAGIEPPLPVTAKPRTGANNAECRAQKHVRRLRLGVPSPSECEDTDKRRMAQESSAASVSCRTSGVGDEPIISCLELLFSINPLMERSESGFVVTNPHDRPLCIYVDHPASEAVIAVTIETSSHKSLQLGR